MKFSIITPSYNQGKYIQDCISSVSEQAASNITIEHIVIDAVSTDQTVEILKASPNLTWTSEPDGGQTDAINKGFERATGEWLMWLNADDFLLPGALEQIYKFSLKNPTADMIYGDCQFVDESKRFIRHKREHSFDFGVLLYYGCYIPSTSTFINQRIFKQGLHLDPSFKVCMDFDYYIRIAESSFSIKYIPSVLASFRWHDSNISSLYLERRKEERFRVQQRTLQNMGRRFFMDRRSLRYLYQLYRLKRFYLKVFSAVGQGVHI